MAVQVMQRMTAAEFDGFALLPENTDRLLEFVGGEVCEVVSNSFSSEVGANILAELRAFVKKKRLGRITGADGGYVVAGERYIPDVAYISYERQPQPSHEAYNPNPPDLAVEVLSPSDDQTKMRVKVVNYLRAGVVVWVVNPDARTVEVYAPGQAARIMDVEGILDGGDVLPGFTLAVKDLFPA